MWVEKRSLKKKERERSLSSKPWSNEILRNRGKEEESTKGN